MKNAESENLKVLEHLFASGELLSSQLPSQSTWSPEKRLAGAVLASGLSSGDFRWINSNKTDWPFSFLRLCELFELDPSWVRRTIVRRDRTAESRRETFRRAA